MASSDIKEIEGFLKLLSQRKILPDDNGQAVIERVGDSHDPSALPILRNALTACVDYSKWANSLDKEVPGLWIYELLAQKMEKRLQVAIEKCSPQGEPAVKWWQFWKR